MRDNRIRFPSVICTFLFTAGLFATGCHSMGAARRPALTIADSAAAIPVIVSTDAAEATVESAEDLARYIERITGARPAVVRGLPDPIPEHAVWVGIHPELADFVPDLDLEFQHPEEILLHSDGRHVVIAGRDRFNSAGRQVEFGTANAVHTFLQDHLDIRWFWPGELGEDVPGRDRIEIAPFTHRFHPRIRERRFRYHRSYVSPEEVEWWEVRQRGRGSMVSGGWHAFGDWWERYHEEHPDYFALRPDGTRTPAHSPGRVKLCISNPRVAEQWLDNAEAKFRADPDKVKISVAPTDSGGWCVCENCMAWDHPDGPPGMLYGEPYVMLTDRYVRFWNILARGIRERLPDREVILSTIAYGMYRTPPVGERLDDNILIGYVSTFPLSTPQRREQHKAEFKAWSEKASMIRFRPNWFYWAGGVWGLPDIAPCKTMEDFRFLVDHHCIALDVDTVRLHWATQGLQFYVSAQFAYDPFQDGQDLIEDYHRRCYGPAAGPMAAYWDLLAESRKTLMSAPRFADDGRASMYYRRGLLDEFLVVYNDDFFRRADALFREAEAKTSGAEHEVYRARVDFTRVGLEYTRLTMEIIPEMARLRETGGHDQEALARAIEIDRRREALYEDAPQFALNAPWLKAQINRRIGAAYLGPPLPEWIEAGAEAGGRPRRLAAAEWEPALSDDFNRDELGGDWQIVEGDWRIVDGRLHTDGGVLVTADTFPGLHRIEIEARADTTAPERFATQQTPSDLSVFIHGDRTGHRSGYFLQFGGARNTLNTLRRLGDVLADNREPLIDPARTHLVIGEFDGQHVRLTVDGEVVFEHQEPAPLLGPGHDKLGLYFYSPAIIERIRISTAEARDYVDGEDDPDME